jgi:hypothetical protein
VTETSVNTFHACFGNRPFKQVTDVVEEAGEAPDFAESIEEIFVAIYPAMPPLECCLEPFPNLLGVDEEVPAQEIVVQGVRGMVSLCCVRDRRKVLLVENAPPKVRCVVKVRYLQDQSRVFFAIVQPIGIGSRR